MISLNQPEVRTWGQRLAALILILVALFWVGCHLFVPGLIKKSVVEYGTKLGYEIAYQDLSISPLRLRFEVEGLHLSKEGGNKLLEFQKCIIALKWTKLIFGELGFDEIVLQEPKLLLERKLKPKITQSDLWNWQEFIHAVQKNLPSKEHGEKTKPIKLSIDELVVTNASLQLLDESKKFREELKPFSIKLFEVANYDKGGNVSGIRGQYGLNLDSLELLIPGINKTIAFKRVEVGGKLDNPSPNLLGAQLDLKLDDGTILSHWDFNTSTKALTGKVSLDKIATAPFIPLLPANKDLIGSSGILSAELIVKLGSDAESVSGNADLKDIAILEKGEKTPLITWDDAAIRQFEYRSIKNGAKQTSALSIDDVILEHPALRFEINPQGLSNFRRLFSKSALNESGKSESSSDMEVGDQLKANSVFDLDIRSVNLRSGEVLFADLAMRPNFTVDVKKFNATFLGISNTPGRFASVAMDGVVANFGSMRAKGQTAFDDPRRNHDIAINFKNLPLTTFNPAVMTYAGYQITGGKLNLNLNYRAKNGELNGSNQIIINKVQLGDEVADFQGKKLPLGLAIALLEDVDDTIDVTIRIAGNVDSPQFSASGLVWQAISNVLSNVATAPFRALASLMGMSESEGVYAVPGEAIFLPVDQERLEKFAEYLAKRPNSSLEIIATYDLAQDKQAMARAKADATILKDAGFKLQAGEPIPSPSLSDPRIQSGLKAAYAQYVGRIQLGQRLLMLPDGEARNEQLHTELIAGIEVTDAELKMLAKTRAQLAFDIMAKSNPTLKERISIGDVKSVQAGKEGIPLDVELRIK